MQNNLSKQDENLCRLLGLHPENLIGSGMEASVYRFDAEHVLKIYHPGSTSFSKLQTLKNFYQSLDTSHTAIVFPNIEHIIEQDHTLLTIEKLIDGTPMKNVLANASEETCDQLLKSHFHALLQMKNVRLPANFTGIKLFHDIASPEHKDWHQYLDERLVQQLSNQRLLLHLQQNVSQFMEKRSILRQMLSKPYTGEYTLIHGDFCPENLLVNGENVVVGIIDFGMMTMRGDFLFDVATGWLFLDMYDEYDYDFKANYQNLVVQTFGEDVKEKLSLYVLLYSLYSICFYSNDFRDGHAKWCIQTLNDAALWKELSST